MIKTVSRRAPVAPQSRPTTLAGIMPAGCAGPGLGCLDCAAAPECPAAPRPGALGCAGSSGCSGCSGCGSRKAALGEIDIPGIGAVNWQTLALIAAVAFIVLNRVFFSHSKVERRRKLREARESYQRKVAAIRKEATA